MYKFKTVEEKAEEWGITMRHIQSLCRQGKINGAIKRVGAWFIPQDAPCPAKNSKSKDKPYMFIGTKGKIFDNAIELITARGYENVSINDIAEAANIRQSAVYNHFKSKQEILNTIFEFYQHYFFATRPTADDLEVIIKKGSIFDIISIFSYNFDKEVLQHMSNMTKIIMQRMITDERAREMYKKITLEEGIRFVEEGLNKAIELGRIAPVDTHMVAVMINSTRIYTCLWWVIESFGENHIRSMDDEHNIYKYISDSLVDLKAPVK